MFITKQRSPNVSSVSAMRYAITQCLQWPCQTAFHFKFTYTFQQKKKRSQLKMESRSTFLKTAFIIFKRWRGSSQFEIELCQCLMIRNFLLCSFAEIIYINDAPTGLFYFIASAHRLYCTVLLSQPGLVEHWQQRQQCYFA